jgi:hypothetical protein
VDLIQVLENQIDCMGTPESQTLQFKKYDDIKPARFVKTIFIPMLTKKIEKGMQLFLQ